MIKSNLGKQIKRLRLYAGMTQEEFSKKVGVSRPTISSWEVDRTEPSMQDVQKMAAVLDCSVNDIIGNYKNDLIRSHNIERIVTLSEKLTNDGQQEVIKFIEYMLYKDGEENRQDGNI